LELLRKIWLFYYEGFRSMTVGKKLWIIILIKLFILFFILKLFFFPNILSQFNTEEEKSDHVHEQLIKRH